MDMVEGVGGKNTEGRVVTARKRKSKKPAAGTAQAVDPTLDALERSLDTFLFDTLRVIADRLEETGEVMLARAYRWLVKNGRVPRCYGGWNGWSGEKSAWQKLTKRPSDLAYVIIGQLNKLENDCKRFSSYSQSYRVAAQALVKAGHEGKGPLAGEE